MSEPSSPKAHGVRRWAIGAATTAIPLALAALAAVNFLQAADTNALAEHEEATVATLERRVSAIDRRATRHADMTAIYLAGDTAAIARAELQRRLSAAVGEVQGRLIETQDPGDAQAEDAPDDGRVELRVTFDARNDGLLDLLYRLETGAPLLTIERIEARRLDAGPDAAAEDPTLRIGLVVRGYRKLPS